MKTKINDVLKELNDIYRMQNPESEGLIIRTDCESTKWHFWSDTSSSEHIQFSAYKAKQRIERAKEEADYTQKEIYSVLRWSKLNLETAIQEQSECQKIDFTYGFTSQAFYNEKLQQAQERYTLWEEKLRPLLTITIADLDELD